MIPFRHPKDDIFLHKKRYRCPHDGYFGFDSIIFSGCHTYFNVTTRISESILCNLYLCIRPGLEYLKGRKIVTLETDAKHFLASCSCIAHVLRCVYQWTSASERYLWNCACGRFVSKILRLVSIFIVGLIMALNMRCDSECLSKCFSAVESEKYLNYIFLIEKQSDIFLQQILSILERSGNWIYPDGMAYSI